jgi:(p)ppGpp synthase/HD superfamily hydrolase
MFKTIEDKALFDSINYHYGQKYGQFDYIDHIEQVVDVTKYILKGDVKLFNSESITVAAYLHDIIEDTDYTIDMLKSNYSDVIAEMVRLVTDPEGMNRKERKAKLYEQFRDYEIGYIKMGASIVKLADRYSNHFNVLLEKNIKKAKMYKDEFPEFINTFYVKGHKGIDKMYYALNDQADSLDRLIINENRRDDA